MSTVIRFAYASYPAILILPSVYEYLNSKWRKVAFALIPLTLTLVAFVGLPLLQSGVSAANYNVYFNLNYETPYLKAYNYFQSIPNQKVVVFAEPYPRVGLFLYNLVNITFYGFYTNETVFDEIIHYDYWQGVYVYGEFYANYYLSLQVNAPFMLQLITQNQSKYQIQTVWWDQESYLVEVKV